MMSCPSSDEHFYFWIEFLTPNWKNQIITIIKILMKKIIIIKVYVINMLVHPLRNLKKKKTTWLKSEILKNLILIYY